MAELACLIFPDYQRYSNTETITSSLEVLSQRSADVEKQPMTGRKRKDKNKRNNRFIMQVFSCNFSISTINYSGNMN
ncbi:MAG: hypothetical protein JXA96_08440 [Sedimentisphaerales bacterium]|nr:hypothetical protein [Sedimentisphaerales bacterium]